MKALLVDVRRERRRQLRAALQTLEWKVEVIEAASGEEAGLIFARQPVDLLVTSLRLAGISGAELAQRARKRRPGIKVILLESAADGHLRDEAAGAVADAVLEWPVGDETFLEAARRCLQTGDTATLFPQTEPAGIAHPRRFSLTQRLEALRIELDAQACILLDGNAQALGRAGEMLPALEHGAFASSIPAALQAIVGVSSALGAGGPGGVLWLAAGRLEVCLAPVDTRTWLLAAFSRQPEGERSGSPARDIDRIQRAAAGLAAQEVEPPVETRAQPAAVEEQSAEISPERPLEPDPELEKLLSRGGRKRIKTKELNDFWDRLADEPGGVNREINGGNAISYDEARRRGLTPGDE